MCLHVGLSRKMDGIVHTNDPWTSFALQLNLSSVHLSTDHFSQPDLERLVTPRQTTTKRAKSKKEKKEDRQQKMMITDTTLSTVARE